MFTSEYIAATSGGTVAVWSPDTTSCLKLSTSPPAPKPPRYAYVCPPAATPLILQSKAPNNMKPRDNKQASCVMVSWIAYNTRHLNFVVLESNSNNSSAHRSSVNAKNLLCWCFDVNSKFFHLVVMLAYS